MFHCCFSPKNVHKEGVHIPHSPYCVVLTLQKILKVQKKKKVQTEFNTHLVCRTLLCDCYNVYISGSHNYK